MAVDKPHIITMAIEDDGRFFIDYVHQGNRCMGYYNFGELLSHIKHECIIKAALDVAGTEKGLSFKERIAVFSLIGANR